LQAQRENKVIIPCILRDVSYDKIKWDLGRIQGIEFDDKFDLARNFYSRIANIQKKEQGDLSVAKNPNVISDKENYDQTLSRYNSSSLPAILESVYDEKVETIARE
jgi:hypothetical protein